MPEAVNYHHAHLRQTLIDAAVQLIGEVGPRAFTLREVSRRAGVSHNAPYRHFSSKDELLVVVAEQGFVRLTAAMTKRMTRGRSPREQLQLCGCGYVAFALRWPHHFLVMFDLPAGLRERCRADRVGENAFKLLLGCVEEAQLARELGKTDSLHQAWAAWSLVHGIAKLAVSGNLPLSARSTIAFTRQATESFINGLAATKL